MPDARLPTRVAATRRKRVRARTGVGAHRVGGTRLRIDVVFALRLTAGAGGGRRRRLHQARHRPGGTHGAGLLTAASLTLLELSVTHKAPVARLLTHRVCARNALGDRFRNRRGAS